MTQNGRYDDTGRDKQCGNLLAGLQKLAKRLCCVDGWMDGWMTMI